MAERNLCAELGCPARCCQNVFIEVSLAERKRVFPTAKPVNCHATEDLIFMSQGEDFVVRIRGGCPHLGAAGECLIYRERPVACRNFAVDGEKCLEMRRRASLPIPIQEILNPIFE